MILPLLGTVAKMAIKGVASRSRRKKGEGAQVSKSIVQDSKNKKSSALVKPTTPIFGGSKQTTETSSSIQSSSIVESLNKIDKSIANIRSIIESESKFKSKINANNLRKQNLLMKRNKEKELKSKKTSVSVTGRTISKMGSFLSRFLPFIVATLLGSVVLSIYKGLGAIIKFFQNIFNALNGFFAALDPFIRPILDFFNLFRKQDAGELDPKIGEKEEEKVKELEKRIAETESQSEEFIKEFNKQREELAKESDLLSNRIASQVNQSRMFFLNRAESGDIASTAADISLNTTVDTLEVNPTVSMVNNNLNINQSNEESDNVIPQTPMFADSEDDAKIESAKNLTGVDNFMPMNEENDTKLALNQGPSSPIKFYPDTGRFLPNMGGGRPGNIRLKGGAAFPKADAGDDIQTPEIQNEFNFSSNEIAQSNNISEQTFYEVNQRKTDVIFVSQNTPQSSMGGRSFILPLGTSMGGVSALNSKRSSEFENRMYTT